MEEQHYKLINAFKNLDVEDKKQEIFKNIHELLNLLYYANKKIDEFNKILPVLNSEESEDEYFDKLFTYVISLKEENAKLIEKINNN